MRRWLQGLSKRIWFPRRTVKQLRSAGAGLAAQGTVYVTFSAIQLATGRDNSLGISWLTFGAVALLLSAIPFLAARQHRRQETR